MYAQELPDGTISVKGAREERRFVRIHAGAALSDAGPGFICVLGCAAGRYTCLDEREGDMSDLTDAAFEFSNRLCVETVWIAPQAISVMDDLREAAPRRSVDAAGPVFVTPPIFQDTRATAAAVGRIRTLMARGRFTVHASTCPRITHMLNRPPEIAAKSAALRALTYAFIGLELQDVALPCLTRREWYPTLERRG